MHSMRGPYLLIIVLLLWANAPAAFAGAEPADSETGAVAILVMVPGEPGARLAVDWDGPEPAWVRVTRLVNGKASELGQFALVSGVNLPDVRLDPPFVGRLRLEFSTSGDTAFLAEESIRQLLAAGTGDSAWVPGPYGPGVDAPVRALAVFDDGDGPALFLGGDFLTAGEGIVNHIARWDGSGWSGLGPDAAPGTDAPVRALTVHDGALFVGGDFTTAGVISASGIARWDGSEWSAPGTGIDGTVQPLLSWDGLLVAGGDFDGAGSENAANIAAWDGSVWQALSGSGGNGTTGAVRALAEYQSDLLAGGTFAEAGGVEVSNVARFNGSHWHPLSGSEGTGTAGQVHGLAVREGLLYVGGTFESAGGTDARWLAAWNGVEWSDVAGFDASGTFGGVEFLTSIDGSIYVNRWSSPVIFPDNYEFLRWNGGEWTELGMSLNGPVLAASDFQGGMAVAGEFSATAGMGLNRIARWDGSQWNPLGDPVAVYGATGSSQAVEMADGGIVASQLRFIPGHGFTRVVTEWSDGEWNVMGGPFQLGSTALPGQVMALHFHDGQWFAGGRFTSADGESVTNLARFDGVQWQAVPGSKGEGVLGDVSTLETYRGKLVAGGNFAEAGGRPASNIAAWDGSTWQTLSGDSGEGTDGLVLALEAHEDDLYVGGGFQSAGAVTAGHVARWDGSDWWPMDDGTVEGTDDWVHALATFNGALVVGGGFSHAGGEAANRVATWDGSNWAPLGDGFDGAVLTLAVQQDTLVAGGSFGEADGAPATRLARWNGENWSPLLSAHGEGAEAQVQAIGGRSSTGTMVVGGDFLTVAGKSHWNIAVQTGELIFRDRFSPP